MNTSLKHGYRDTNFWPYNTTYALATRWTPNFSQISLYLDTILPIYSTHTPTIAVLLHLHHPASPLATLVSLLGHPYSPYIPNGQVCQVCQQRHNWNLSGWPAHAKVDIQPDTLRHRGCLPDLTWISCFYRNLRLWRLYIKPCPCPWGVFPTPDPAVITFLVWNWHMICSESRGWSDLFYRLSHLFRCCCPSVPCIHAPMHPRIQANVDEDHSPQKPWLLARHIFATHITQLCWSFLKVDFFGAKSMSALKIEKFVKLFMVSSVTLWKFVHAPGEAANTFYAKGAI